MEAISMDLRKRVIRACDEKLGPQPQIAKIFGVSVSFITKLLRRRRETGSIAPQPHGGGVKPIFNRQRLKKLESLVERQPDATLIELKGRMELTCSQSTVHRALTRLNLTFKKRP